MWMYARLQTSALGGADDALSVIRGSPTSCEGFVALFVALCRAAGLPARGTGGLAYAQEGFAAHAWAEVYVGRWIAVDPTWCQPIASVARIKLDEDLDSRIIYGFPSIEVVPEDDQEAE